MKKHLTFLMLLCTCAVHGQNVTVSSLAGYPPYVDGVGTAASFNNPLGVAVDASGNIYVADQENHRIRKITAAGIVSTLAGNTSGYANGTGTEAQFSGPTGVAVDGSGNVYVADYWNHCIRKISPTGVVSTLAGNGTSGYVDDTGAAAKFNNPKGVAVDGSGNVYVTEYINHRIRKITPDGVVSTLAGSTQGYAEGTGTAAKFSGPSGVAVDGSGNVYVADEFNRRIRKITPGGVVSTLAGSTYGYADGPGAVAKFSIPEGVAVDGGGNVYVTDKENDRIRKITPAGEVSTLAGSAQGHADGTGSAAQFNRPGGVAVDGSGNVYVTDNFCIRKITPGGVVSTLAGRIPYADGTGTAATFFYPSGAAVDGSGNVYVADQFNHRIRKITPDGVVSTLAGSTQGYADGAGTAAKFSGPTGVAVDVSGNVYVADQDNNRIRMVTPGGVVSTLAGSTQGYTDGTSSAAKFSYPTGLAVDINGNVYVSDLFNHRIRKITPDGVVSTLAGSTEGYADGTGAEAKFGWYMQGVAVDGSGNVYVADASNDRIRKITQEGVVSTLAGSSRGYADGTGTAAQFDQPQGVAVDGGGNVYVADFVNDRIRKITPDGVVSTLAGSTKGYADGTGTEAKFDWPYGVAVDTGGNVYVTDARNNLIRKIEHLSCPDLLTLSSPADDYSTGDVLKEASAADGSITAANKITGDANVSYQARFIVLNPGFTAAEGTVFKALVGGCE